MARRECSSLRSQGPRVNGDKLVLIRNQYSMYVAHTLLCAYTGESSFIFSSLLCFSSLNGVIEGSLFLYIYIYIFERPAKGSVHNPLCERHFNTNNEETVQSVSERPKAILQQAHLYHLKWNERKWKETKGIWKDVETKGIWNERK